MYRKFSGAAEDIEQLLVGAENGVEVEFPNGTLYTIEDATDIYEEVERRKLRLFSKVQSFMTGLFAVPLGLLALGFVISWIARGFTALRENVGGGPR